jgi:large subunit ribosomal protein L22
MAIEQVAKLNFLRMTPRKVRSVSDLIRGLPVNEAEAQLMVQRRRPAKAILKLLRSAVANAKSNQKLEPSHLFVSAIWVDGGPMLKRMLPRARGSASPIQKKMSHVTIVLGVNAALVSKYKIVSQKKSKLPQADSKSGKAKPTEKSEEEKVDKKKPSFFKRSFNRKAGM